MSGFSRTTFPPLACPRPASGSARREISLRSCSAAPRRE